MIRLYSERSSALCLILFSNMQCSSSNTPILVEANPGFIAKTRNDCCTKTIYPRNFFNHVIVCLVCDGHFLKIGCVMPEANGSVLRPNGRRRRMSGFDPSVKFQKPLSDYHILFPLFSLLFFGYSHLVHLKR